MKSVDAVLRRAAKANLEAIFRSWERDEAEAIDVIEAVGAYLGPERKPGTPAVFTPILKGEGV